MSWLIGNRIQSYTRVVLSFSRSIHITPCCLKYPLSYYREVLGVTADSKPDEIKKAFYKQSKRYHPDLHPDDKVKQQRYLTITEAYSILTDEYKTSSKDIKSNQQVQKGAKFAKGSFRSDSVAGKRIPSIQVKTPMGFGRGTAKTSFQTGTFQSAKDEFVTESLKTLHRTQKK